MTDATRDAVWLYWARAQAFSDRVRARAAELGMPKGAIYLNDIEPPEDADARWRPTGADFAQIRVAYMPEAAGKLVEAAHEGMHPTESDEDTPLRITNTASSYHIGIAWIRKVGRSPGRRRRRRWEGEFTRCRPAGVRAQWIRRARRAAAKGDWAAAFATLFAITHAAKDEMCAAAARCPTAVRFAQFDVT